MATNNPALYGFRFHKSIRGGRNMPDPEEGIVATSQSFDVTGGASNVSLRKGDPLIALSTGGFALAVGAETTAVVVSHICVGIEPYYDAATGSMRQADRLPSDVAWGTNLNRQSKILAVRVDACVWEIDVDENTTATTLAGYQAFRGENADHVLTGVSTDAFEGKFAVPLLDISGHVTSTMQWRIWGVSGTKNNMDFAGERVKLLVVPNEVSTMLEWGGTTGI